MDTKTESILLLHIRNTSKFQRKTFPQGKLMGKDLPIKWTQGASSVATLISNKLDFKSKSIKRDEDSNFILVTGEIHQHKLSILNIYAPNTKVPT